MKMATIKKDDRQQGLNKMWTKRESLHTVDENVIYYKQYGKQYGGSSKIKNSITGIEE
jgi:hypothetical protein